MRMHVRTKHSSMCCDMQARPPGKAATTERNLFVLHVLQLLLGLGAVQPLFWLVSSRCWKLFLAISAICFLYKVRFAKFLSLRSSLHKSKLLFWLITLKTYTFHPVAVGAAAAEHRPLIHVIVL